MVIGTRIIISVTVADIYSANGGQSPVGTCTTIIYTW